METHQGDDDEHGGSDGSHNVGPNARAVHEPLEPTQVLLEQWAVLVVEHNLKVTLHGSISAVSDNAAASTLA